MSIMPAALSRVFVRPCRSRRTSCVGCVLVVFSLNISTGTAGQIATALEVTHQARSLQPGEAVLITIRNPRPLAKVVGDAFGRQFLFYSSSDPRVWRGLIGIDLETKPGRYSVQIDGTGSDGETIHGEHTLLVRGKIFPTRQLTVDEKFVTPPKEVEERIRLESKRVEQIFAAVAQQKMWEGPFTRPVPGQANDNFGKRSILNGKPRSPHTGVDFTAAAGTPIRAPNSGRVVLAEDLYFSGNTIILDHGQGLYSFFAHLSRFSVHEGDQVNTKQILGRVGSTGRSTGPHLHWTVRLAGTRIDPLSLMAVLKPSRSPSAATRK